MKRSRSLGLVAAAVVLATSCVAGDPSSTVATTRPVVDAPSTTTPATLVLGETEVQVVSRLPLLPVDWRTVELDLEETGAWLTSLVTVDGEFVVSAVAWDGEAQTLLQWRSTDTVTWDRAETVFIGGWVHQVLSVGGRLMAIGSNADPAGPDEPRLWTHDGSEWVARDLGLTADPDSSLYLYGAAANDAGVLLAGDRQPYDPIGPTILTTGGFRIEIDSAAGTYTVTETTTGRLRSSGPMSDVYRWSETGQILYDPVTGEVLTEVPWDRWSELYPGSSPLPIAIPFDPAAEPPSIDWAGFRITIDDRDGVFEIVRIASGEVLRGTLEELYRGPGPRFHDDQTGEVVLALTWPEWDDLMSRSWGESEEGHEPHDTEIVLLFSSDTVNWEAQTLDLAPNTHLEAVTSVAGRFVVTTIEHYEEGSNRMAWVSDDGQTWENVGTTGPSSLLHLAVGLDSLVALAEQNGRLSAATSADGLVWREELSIGMQSDGQEAWLDLIATGPLGTAVAGTIHPPNTSPWLAVTVGDRTARFGPEWAVEIVDTATATVVLALTWDQIDNADGVVPPVVYRDGATWFYDGAGELVLRIPDDEVYAAYEAQSQANAEEYRKVLFLETTDGVWHETSPVPADRRGSDQQLAIGEDHVIIGRMIWQPGEFEDAEPESIHLVVGTPAR